MKFGVAVSTFPSAFGPLMLSGRLAEHLPRLADLGFQGIDLFIRRADEPGLEAVINAIHASGLQVAIVAAVSAFVDEGLFLSSPDADVRLQMIERMKLQVQLAARLEGRVPIGVLRGKTGGEERQRLLADSLFEVSRYAAGLGVELVIEPVNRYETGLINTVQEAFDFITRFGLPPFKILADVFHMNIEEVSIEHSLLAAGKRLGHVHFADSNRHVPGQGHLNWNAILSALKECGYAGFCSFECLPGPDPLADLEDGLRFLRNFNPQ